MINLSKQDLEKMLVLLNLSTLDAINSKYRTDTYIWGKAKLLNYTPEALKEYAEAIYRYILPHFGPITETLEEYIAKWLAPETAFADWLSSNEERFISTLETIASNPIIYPNVIIEPEYDVYGLITDFIQGDRAFYETINDLLFSIKLRNEFITDTRIIALVTEIDTMRNKCNKQLTAFIGQEIDHTWLTEKVISPDGKSRTEKYKMAIPSTTYGTELKLLRQPVLNGLDFYSLKPSTISTLKANSSLIPATDWATISKAIEEQSLTSQVRKLITASLKIINQTKNSGSTITRTDDINNPAYDKICAEINENIKSLHYLKYTTKEAYITTQSRIDRYIELMQDKNSETLIQSSAEVHALTVEIKDLFIGYFVAQLETYYFNLSVPTEVTTQDDDGEDDNILDDIFAEIDLLHLAQENEVDFGVLQAQQTVTESWYSDYNNIRQSLMACLQIALNSINPNTVLSDKILSHKAIVGMLAFAEQVKTLLNARIIMLDYKKLAKELQQQLRENTSVFVDLAPLPNIRPMNKEEILNAQNSTVQRAKLADTSFNITKNIQQDLDKLKPALVLTEYKKMNLSNAQIQSLVPVPDRTITQLLMLFAGKGTKPFMLDGDLFACINDAYIKIIPEIDKDGYASYKFTAINGKALNFLIDRYCELLQVTPHYTNLLGYNRDPGAEYFGIEPVYDYDSENVVDDDDFVDVDGDDYTLKTLNLMLKARMQSSRKYLGLMYLSEKLKLQKANYAEDIELLEYLITTVKRVYKELESPYYVPYTKYYDPPYYISGHHLSAWIYHTEDYTANITNDDYQVDHIKRGVKYRSDNRPSNLRIVPADFNSGRTSRSIEVTYNGAPFVSLSAYCTKTAAGDYDNLLALKDSLQPGEVKESKGRLYTLGAEEQQLIVTDAETKASGVTYNGMTYATPKAFADDVKIDYKSLHNALRAARKAGNSKFSRKFKNKKYTFYLDVSGNITHII